VLTDILVLGQWWLTLVILGFVGWPLVKAFFERWENHGYILAKAVGLLSVTYVVWVIGSFRLLPFNWLSIFLSAVVVGMVGWILIKPRLKNKVSINWKAIIIEEVFFLVALIFWSWIKAHEPTINGLEKFMDYGFTKSILRGVYFPPLDMWFAGSTINYYYFGHLMMAALTKFSGVDLTYGFNLMLTTIFALTLTMSFSIGKHILSGLSNIHKISGALFIAFLVTLSGNLHTIYAFTTGYWGEENPPLFWKIFSPLSDSKKFAEGWDNYWYPNATRFIPYTIHEFPSYSFVVSDVHGHVLAIPIALLMIAMLIVIFGKEEGP
jgi:YYY domain-containing protein